MSENSTISITYKEGFVIQIKDVIIHTITYIQEERGEDKIEMKNHCQIEEENQWSNFLELPEQVARLPQVELQPDFQLHLVEFQPDVHLHLVEVQQDAHLLVEFQQGIHQQPPRRCVQLQWQCTATRRCNDGDGWSKKKKPQWCWKPPRRCRRCSGGAVEAMQRRCGAGDETMAWHIGVV